MYFSYSLPPKPRLPVPVKLFPLLRTFLVVLLICPSWNFGRDFTVSGIVRDAITGKGLAETQVILMNASTGTVTNQSGRFQIQAPRAGSVKLRFTHIGYEPEELAIDLNPRGSANLSVTLTPRQIDLPAVQVEATASPRNLSLPAGTFHRFRPSEEDILVARDVSDLLVRIPEIERQSRGPGQTPKITLRGSQANQVLILVNGQPVQTGSSGGFDVNQIAPQSIGEIQIAPGNQSSRYGSQAMGGVVNIILAPAPQDEQYGLTATTGNWGQQRMRARGEVRRRTFSVSAHGNWETGQNNYPYTVDGESFRRQNAAHSQQSLWLNTTYSPRSGLHWESLGFVSHSQQGLPGPLYELTPDATRDALQQHLATQVIFNKNSWSVTSATTWDRTEQNQSAQESVFGGYHLQTAHGLLEQSLKGTYQSESTALGLEMTWRGESLDAQDRLRPQYSLGQHERDTRAIVASGEYHLPISNYTLSPTLMTRYETTGRSEVSFTWQTHWRLHTERFSTWIKMGTGYRLPSFWELFWVPDAYAVGNPDLNPERSRDAEWGLRFTDFSPWQVTLSGTVYRQKYTDLISWVRGYANRFAPENVESAQITGYNVLVSLTPWANYFMMDVMYDARRPINLTPGANSYQKYLPYRALHQVTVNTKWQWRSYFLQTTWHAQGRTYIRKANTKWLEPFSDWTMAVGNKFSFATTTLTTNLTIHNLTNQQYEVLERYPLPGRQVSFSLSASI
ncbi:MAG: TonB-dependent receptor [Lentisphaeria bacterium]|nr:TonB-dependent receptor [Candidatus Neomarinimicrobiota bacterium]MCF7842699.1 TonB-dependent receptor [Lentisphaeria bacterium]